MRPLRLLLLAGIPLIAQAPAAGDLVLSRAEKAQAMDLLARGKADLEKSLAGLSQAQLHFKTSPDRWSILECAEHIALTAEFLGEKVVFKGLSGPPEPAKRAEIGAVDSLVILGVEDRSKTFQAPDMLKPPGKWKDGPSVLAAYASAHARLAGAIEKGEGLRVRVAPHPAFGALDLYQWVLLTGAHTRRHLQQIAEVKTSPGYPAK
ncbi:MAG: DinB family protein [Acidobacteria bacterium]|nr:DinB family protein [Acidobacteriota bacterium]